MERAKLRRASAAALILGGLGALGACSADDSNTEPDAPSATTIAPTPLEAAADAANVEVDGVVRADVEGLIQAVCDGRSSDELAADVVALDITDSEELRLILEGVGNGVEQLCPEIATEAPGLINDTHAKAVSLVAG